MRAVNLLPKQVTKSAGSKLSLRLVGAGAAPVVAGCLVFVGYTISHSSLHGKQGELSALRAQLAALPASAKPKQPSHAGLISEGAARRTALDAALVDRLPWDVALNDIARVLPNDVWLTSLGLTSPSPADSSALSTATPNGFTISGYTFSQVSVARLLTRLQLLPMLSGVTLGSTSSSTLGNKNLIQFAVTAAVAPPTGPAAT